MFSRLNRFALCFALSACSSGAASTAVTPAQVTHSHGPGTVAEVTRTLLAHEDIADMPGFESRIYLIDYPPGVAAGLHVHTEQAIGYVLEGSFESVFGDGPVTVKHAGESFVEPPHLSHRFRNPDPARPLRFVVTGTFRNGEPAFQPMAGSAAFPTSAQSPAALVAQPPVSGTAPSVAAATEVKRTLLTQSELVDLPGMESRIYLMEFPPSARSKLHLHTAQGIGYVIEGSFESKFGDGPAQVKRAGDGFIDVPGKPHQFRNPDPAQPLRFLVAGTYHKDEPLFQLLEQ